MLDLLTRLENGDTPTAREIHRLQEMVVSDQPQKKAQARRKIDRLYDEFNPIKVGLYIIARLEAGKKLKLFEFDMLRDMAVHNVSTQRKRSPAYRRMIKDMDEVGRFAPKYWVEREHSALKRVRRGKYDRSLSELDKMEKKYGAKRRTLLRWSKEIAGNRKKYAKKG